MSDRHQFRAIWHDYNDGIFFVTICSAHKHHYFGEIRENKMQLSSIGIIVEKQIENIPNHFVDAEIWNYVIMPNHIHLVIAVGTLFKASDKTKSLSEETISTSDKTNPISEGTISASDKTNPISEGTISASDKTTPLSNQNLGCLKPRQHEAPQTQDFHHNNRLSVIIRCLKGGVTRDAGRLGLCFAWQSRFHEHIIRNQRAFNNIMNYIDLNVENWCYDRFNPDCIAHNNPYRTGDNDPHRQVGTHFNASASTMASTNVMLSSNSDGLSCSDGLSNSDGLSCSDALKSVPTASLTINSAASSTINSASTKNIDGHEA